MDLGAYMDIENLSTLAKAIGCDNIPRLRGYRLMKNESPVTEEAIHEMIEDQKVEEARALCVSDWGQSDWHTYSSATDAIRRKYLISRMVDNPYREGDRYMKEVGIRWDRIHGKRRKILKWRIRQAEKRIRDQYSLWNQYAGQDVLYIHSRMGNWNWKCYLEKEEILKAPWFLGRVDDYWDSTYCDFYAKIPADKIGVL